MASPYNALGFLDFLTGTPDLPTNFPGPPPPGYYPNGSMYKPPAGTPPIAPTGQAPTQTPGSAAGSPNTAPATRITLQGTLDKLSKLPELLGSLEKLVLANGILAILLAAGLLMLIVGGLAQILAPAKEAITERVQTVVETGTKKVGL